MGRRVALIVQARMGSKRLPGKVLKEVMGRPLLSYQLERLKRVESAHCLVVATSLKEADLPICLVSEREGASCFRGSEEDVLERYFQASSAFSAEVIVRITADCPLIDPELIDSAIETFLRKRPDYLSNTLERSYPKGMDVELFSFEALQEARQKARSAWEREHVTPYLYSKEGGFRLQNFSQAKDQSNYRLVVDTQADFFFIKSLLSALYPKNPRFTFQEAVDFADRFRLGASQ